jgi:hypothetical protein
MDARLLSVLPSKLAAQLSGAAAGRVVVGGADGGAEYCAEL